MRVATALRRRLWHRRPNVGSGKQLCADHHGVVKQPSTTAIMTLHAVAATESQPTFKLSDLVNSGAIDPYTATKWTGTTVALTPAASEDPAPPGIAIKTRTVYLPDPPTLTPLRMNISLAIIFAILMTLSRLTRDWTWIR